MANAILNDHLSGVYRRGEMQVPEDLDSIDSGHDELLPDHHTRLREYFADDPELLNLLLQGHSFVECEQRLGVSRRAIRYRVGKARRRAMQPGANQRQLARR
jgi:hypothetical protein